MYILYEHTYIHLNVRMYRLIMYPYVRMSTVQYNTVQYRCTMPVRRIKSREHVQVVMAHARAQTTTSPSYQVEQEPHRLLIDDVLGVIDEEVSLGRANSCTAQRKREEQGKGQWS